MNARYYDPETGRFVSSDAAMGKVGSMQGNNMYQYAFNNPVSMVDTEGEWAAFLVPVITWASAAVAAAATAVVTALEAVVVAGVTVAAAYVAKEAGKKIAKTVVATKKVIKKVQKKREQSHAVYKLVDESKNNKVEYIGRTTNVEKRAKAHKANPFRDHLKLKPIKSGLSEPQAKGLEQQLMLHYHTLNTSNKMHNQRNEISPKNPNLRMYMEAARGVALYLENQISNEILYWTTE